MRSDTIIIGAGISGLGAAHTLHKAKRDFLIISPDIGGRILSSATGEVNYGAYLVLGTYQHVLPYVEKKERLRIFSVAFHSRKRSYTFLRAASYPLQVLRLVRIMSVFRKEYALFKEEIKRLGTKNAIKNNPYICKLYEQGADIFVKKEKIHDLAHRFLQEGAYMCTFLPLSKISALDFLHVCLGLTTPAYEFRFLEEKALQGIEHRVIKDRVVSLKKQGKRYQLQTKKGKMFTAKSVIVATQPLAAARLLNLQHIRGGAVGYMFHLQGELLDQWKDGQYTLFASSSDTIFIKKQKDGSYLFYSRVPKPNLSRFFQKHSVITKKRWQPAFHLQGKILLDNRQGERLYLAGDHNLNGLEVAYINGVHTARQVLSDDRHGSPRDASDAPV